jgi:hypothetical protein
MHKISRLEISVLLVLVYYVFEKINHFHRLSTAATN